MSLVNYVCRFFLCLLFKMFCLTAYALPVLELDSQDDKRQKILIPSLSPQEQITESRVPSLLQLAIKSIARKLEAYAQKKMVPEFIDEMEKLKGHYGGNILPFLSQGFDQAPDMVCLLKETPSYAKIALFLGWCHEKGRVVERNLQQAVYWYEEAANCGNLNAYARLGEVYERQAHVKPENWVTSLFWYKRIFERSYPYMEEVPEKDITGLRPELKFDYGWLTEDRFLKRSFDSLYSEHTLGIYAYKIGYCYEKGLGVAQDWKEAERWYMRRREFTPYHEGERGYWVKFDNIMPLSYSRYRAAKLAIKYYAQHEAGKNEILGFNRALSILKGNRDDYSCWVDLPCAHYLMARIAQRYMREGFKSWTKGDVLMYLEKAAKGEHEKAREWLEEMQSCVLL